ncbi:thioesterase family protein [Poseidonibacter ostreae]|uniref:Thioesterase n=1 Tax=Poseidonibacter ostreae TaxID=2654171 RepID=A0A6L4WPN8_9BACT|nr:thioesterase family protein [Poseidonibacter ostreae]KAB7885355.1 thioesterase [Poseidonibacter ostreae]KAB7885778.1 thioesterase [Poseidonibacter ostreae]KAB7892992.1 thioesterase [Poseidonibacter ostreae]MAC85135.1 thioesterase [Arcobacter sp.]
MNLEIGTKDSIEFKVKNSDLASNLNISKDDGFPDVFATARLVALMECSAAKILIPFLKEGELSVGVNVNVTHLAATLEGDIAVSTATFDGMEGKLYKFSIEVVDSGGKIGTGTHTRAIVSTERLMSGAKKRVSK